MTKIELEEVEISSQEEAVGRYKQAIEIFNDMMDAMLLPENSTKTLNKMAMKELILKTSIRINLSDLGTINVSDLDSGSKFENMDLVENSVTPSALFSAFATAMLYVKDVDLSNPEVPTNVKEALATLNKYKTLFEPEVLLYRSNDKDVKDGRTNFTDEEMNLSSVYTWMEYTAGSRKQDFKIGTRTYLELSMDEMDQKKEDFVEFVGIVSTVAETRHAYLKSISPEDRLGHVRDNLEYSLQELHKELSEKDANSIKDVIALFEGGKKKLLQEKSSGAATTVTNGEPAHAPAEYVKKIAQRTESLFSSFIMCLRTFSTGSQAYKGDLMNLKDIVHGVERTTIQNSPMLVPKGEKPSEQVSIIQAFELTTRDSIKAHGSSSQPMQSLRKRFGQLSVFWPIFQKVVSGIFEYNDLLKTVTQERERNTPKREKIKKVVAPLKASPPSPPAPEKLLTEDDIYPMKITGLENNYLKNSRLQLSDKVTERNPGERARLDHVMSSIEGLAGCFDANCPWQKELANELLLGENIKFIKNSVLAKADDNAANLESFAESFTRKAFAEINNHKNKFSAAFLMLMIIDNNSEQLLAAIENDTLKETTKRLFANVKEDYKPALRHLTEEQLFQNVELIDELKKNPLTVIFAFGSKKQQETAVTHIARRSVNQADIGSNTLTGIGAGLFNQVQLA